VSCAKTAEPTEMQFGVLSEMGPGTSVTLQCRSPPGKGHFWGVWPIEKHCKAQYLWGW